MKASLSAPAAEPPPFDSKTDLYNKLKRGSLLLAADLLDPYENLASEYDFTLFATIKYVIYRI